MYDYNNGYDQPRHLHGQCKEYMDCHCMFSMKDGSSFDGIILNVDVDNITVLVGEDIIQREDEVDERQYGGYDGYGGYGGYGDYGHHRRRYRRFRRQLFPLAALAGLSLFPYVYPAYPQFPFYPYY